MNCMWKKCKKHDKYEKNVLLWQDLAVYHVVVIMKNDDHMYITTEHFLSLNSLLILISFICSFYFPFWRLVGFNEDSKNEAQNDSDTNHRVLCEQVLTKNITTGDLRL